MFFKYFHTVSEKTEIQRDGRQHGPALSGTIKVTGLGQLGVFTAVGCRCKLE